MNEHKNKHIRTAIDYALSRGWRLEMAGSRAHIWGTLYCPRRGRGAVFAGFSVHRARQRTTLGGCGAEWIIARILQRQAHEDL